jgi:hypothetical protein
MSQDAIILELRAIVRENYLLLEEEKFDRLQAGWLHLSSNAGDRCRVAADLGIPADAKERLGTLKALATV